jgi:hypothetical protein
MDNKEQDAVRNYVRSTLEDTEGISEDALNILKELAEACGDCELEMFVAHVVQTDNGRYVIQYGVPEELK